MTVLCLHFEIKIYEIFRFLTGSDPLVAFDSQTVDNLETLPSNNGYVLMISLCHVIGKDSDFLNIFHNFLLPLTPVTPGQL